MGMSCIYLGEVTLMHALLVLQERPVVLVNLHDALYNPFGTRLREHAREPRDESHGPVPHPAPPPPPRRGPRRVQSVAGVIC